MAAASLSHSSSRWLRLPTPQHGRSWRLASFMPRLTAARRTFKPCAADLQSFEPTLDNAALASQLVVVASTVLSGVYWWYVIVPQERTRLGRSKRMGDVKEYLEELEGDKGRRLERWFYSDWLQQRAKRRQQRAQASAAAEAPTANQAAEGQQGSYGAQSSQAADAPSRRAEEGSSAPSPAPQSKQSLLRPPSDATPTPRFASMDNPLVAAAALLALMATLATAGRALSNLVEGA